MRYAVNCSLLFTELPLLERFAAAAAAGFTEVECWWPFATAAPADAEVDAFAAAVEDAGVALIAMNISGGDMPAGERGLASLPGREREFRDSVDVAAGLAKRLGIGMFNTPYGNRVEGVDPRDQDDLAVQNLSRAAALLGGTVLLEPLSGVPTYPLKTAADAVAVLDRVGSPDIALLADLYHLTVNGDDLDVTIATYAPRIGHVQIADAPGRHEPGTGTIPIARHLAALTDAGYTGRIALEYIPSTTTERAFDWLEKEATT